MASAFGHFAAAAAIGAVAFPRQVSWKTVALTGALACAPDLDVIGFAMGIPYASQWGHRGFTHSLAFSVVFGWAVAWLFYRRSPHYSAMALWCMAAVASHALLDMLTNGGLGVALWWPIDEQRHFFAWRPIQVSPIRPGSFFSHRGLRVLRSEAVWIGLPVIASFAWNWWRNGSRK